MTEKRTGHYLSADRMYVYGMVDDVVFSRYQVSALLQNGRMPKLATPGSPAWFVSETNDPVRFLDSLERNGYVLPAPQSCDYSND